MLESIASPSTTERIINVSRSPKTLHKRNTKNLSLSIDRSNISEAIPETSMNCTFNGTEKACLNAAPRVIGTMQNDSYNISSCNNINDQDTNEKTDAAPVLAPNKKGDASIYTLSAASKSTSASPIYASFKCNESGKLNRNHSMSLSIKTKNLRTHSRNRSQTITAASLKAHTSALSSNEKATTVWVFPESEQRLNNSLTNHTSNNNVDFIHSEIYNQNAYPNGPLLVIPPNIYLYSEPKIEDILGFDLVINVAEEVPDLLDDINKHGRHIVYYHVKWSHNSSIVENLKGLTELVHQYDVQNKKILIHCQCGISRSASLIVGYIMRYNNLNLNDAYSKLKLVAKEISPNMGLIFQLMEWNERLNSEINNDLSSESPNFLFDITSDAATNSKVIINDALSDLDTLFGEDQKNGNIVTINELDSNELISTNNL
ncbi:hypothetical protein KAFR_0J01110 [Kazachstania africana CBS 2517]|uniref:protein-tyrosine-phosphatase n=1 Tax=Kazachstania africana (strain ATCC 22294 / BCRC 22015 / CBS 2517 / CECT 1963 / NBRC 1671 / NRRL Y-8276) TaxID=1071382 RepID=H2B0M8_KAZAF|nr:hypothetical protein KAFR_0J01110 [Kazachstania africana CBS 2517]CCF60178.1 hypothetical protein KAFR_0J01110 [Kazachstania africana CBS 2517]